ncbi:MAG: M48 family metallopeptidase [Deltaproteobacteria bacterium]|nr:M48 family metallopeptidase [Deltaproteobacteria bacterium]
MKQSGRQWDLAGLFVFLIIGVILFIFGAMAGCKTMEVVTKVGTSAGVATGVLSASQAESVTRSVQVVAKTFENFTPEQEYYIGRAVGASVLSKYRPYNDQESNLYLNLLGETLAQASNLPETFGGYHFLILDSDEINAFAAPGGLIFITRGMLRCCEHEDALAAVLAHEIGHVQLKHGLQAIKKSRITTALTTLAIEGARTLGGEELTRLTQTFEDSISDITSTLINNGYSRVFEREADLAALTILKRVGYNTGGLLDMLRVMGERLKPGASDFATTHPSPANRITYIKAKLGEYSEAVIPETRLLRFKAALGNV